MYVDARKLKVVLSRRDQLEKWLEINAAYATREQKQLDPDTPEQAYWHFGYQSALSDIINLLTAASSHNSADTLN